MENTLYLERTGVEMQINNVKKKSLKQKYFIFRLFRRNFLSYISKSINIKFKAKTNFTDKELKIFYLIRKLVKNSDTEIVPSKFGYLISNERLHVECLISTTSIFIANTVATSDNTYSTKLIKKINGMCDNRLSTKCDNIVKSMMSREDIMLNKIIKTI